MPASTKTRFTVKGRSSKQGPHVVQVKVLEDGRKKYTNNVTVPSKKHTFRTKSLAVKYAMPTKK